MSKNGPFPTVSEAPFAQASWHRHTVAQISSYTHSRPLTNKVWVFHLWFFQVPGLCEDTFPVCWPLSLMGNQENHRSSLGGADSWRLQRLQDQIRTLLQPKILLNAWLNTIWLHNEVILLTVVQKEQICTFSCILGPWYSLVMSLYSCLPQIVTLGQSLRWGLDNVTKLLWTFVWMDLHIAKQMCIVMYQIIKKSMCRFVQSITWRCILRHMGLCNRKEDNIHEIFYRGAPWQFYRGLFGRSRGERSDPRLPPNSPR